MEPDCVSVEEFERWFRRESRNVHAWGGEELIRAVLSVEAVLSEYRFGSMDEDTTQKELVNAILPFVLPAETWNVQPVTHPEMIEWTDRLAPENLRIWSFGENHCGSLLPAQIFGSNSTYNPSAA